MRNVVNRIQSRYWAAALLASSLATGCLTELDESVDEDDVAEEQQPSFILTTSAWTSPLNIPVCWGATARSRLIA